MMDSIELADVYTNDYSEEGNKVFTLDNCDHENNKIIITEMLQRTVGLRQCVLLLTGLMCGAGIFITPQIIADNTSSVGVMIIIFIMSGILAMMGSLCYCELGGIFKVAWWKLP